MTTQQKSTEVGFPLYMTLCATIAAFSGFQVGWAIGKWSDEED